MDLVRAAFIVRLRHSAAPLCALAAIVCFARSVPDHEPDPVVAAVEEAWVVSDTECLRRADEHRRAGRWAEALSVYERVMNLVVARPRHRDAARFWHARLRLEAGERSAFAALRDLVHTTMDPRWIVQSVRTLLRERDVLDDAELRGVIDAARSRLRARACTKTAEGERAQRWSDVLDARVAEIFSE